MEDFDSFSLICKVATVVGIAGAASSFEEAESDSDGETRLVEDIRHWPEAQRSAVTKSSNQTDVGD